ncbi:hypothetical protein BG000_009558 [Podila horticola]|nr:hypothetical protein BG000_009558 [Podila horticola]
MGFPIVIVEIKKPGAMDDDIEGDQRRLPCIQKLMLDRMLSAGFKDPKVVGFLIRRSRYEIIIMSLDHEALMLSRHRGCLSFRKTISNLVFFVQHQAR